MSRTATGARFNFEHAIRDVTQLLEIHDGKTAAKAGRPDRELEVLKRAGVILVVTAWESYVEDTLREQFLPRLAKAYAPSDVLSAFNGAADTWLQGKNANPGTLLAWTGDNWKARVKEKFASDIAALNTPDFARVKKLFVRYLGTDVTRSWRWQKTTAAGAGRRLDALIRLRGSLVHRGRRIFDAKQGAKRSDLKTGLVLVVKLVELTDIALRVPPRSYPVLQTGET
jgi:hypothetical protein